MGKKIFKWTAIVLVALLLISVVLGAIFEKEIGEQIIVEINKSLKTELTVKDFDLAVFRHFPNASAELLGVSVKDTKGKVLLEANSIGFKFGIFSLFKDKKQIKSVLIEDGALMISFDKKGRANYDISKSTSVESGGSDMAISLKEAQLKNIELLYNDARSEQEAVFVLENAIFSGEFSTKKFTMESAAKLTSRFIDMGEYRYLAGKEVGYDAKIFVNADKGFYDFEKLNVAIEKNIFKVDGTIDNKGAATDFDLKINCSEGNIGSIIQLLPEQYLNPLSDFSGKGKFLFETTVKGKLTDKTNPAINTKMILKDGRISSPRLTNDLKEVSMSALFSNGNARTSKSSVFRVNDFKGFFNREMIEMGLKMTNMDDPMVDFQLDGAIPMKSIYKLLDNPNISGGKGEIEINNLKIKGKLEDMSSMSKIDRVDASGSLDFDDATLYFKDEKIIFDRGSLVLDDNDLSIKDFKLEGAGSEIAISGHFENLLPVLFADSLNSKKAELKFKASLKADEFDGDRLVALTAVSEEAKEEAESEGKEAVDSLQIAQNENREFFANFLDGTFEAEIENFNYNKIEGENFDGKIIFKNNELSITGSADAMEGYFELDGKFFLEKEPYLNAKIECHEINVNDFFLQTENFGQDFLRAEHVSGELTSFMLINAFWDEKTEFLTDDLIVMAGVGIEDGELKDFDMLEDFSSYIHLNDLKNIKFVDTENWIKVQNSTFYLPSMFVQSNALNMTVAGIHNFEQDIDYNVKINAGQVVVNRLKPHNKKLDPQPSKKKGWFNLYYNVKGNLETDWEVTSKRRKVKADFAKSEKIKKSIQRNLTRKFGKVELLDASRPQAENSEEPLGTSSSSKPKIKLPKFPKPKRTSTTKEEQKDDDDDEFIDGF